MEYFAAYQSINEKICKTQSQRVIATRVQKRFSNFLFYLFVDSHEATITGDRASVVERRNKKSRFMYSLGLSMIGRSPDVDKTQRNCRHRQKKYQFDWILATTQNHWKEKNEWKTQIRKFMSDEVKTTKQKTNEWN